MAMEAPTENTAITPGTTAGKFTFAESVSAVSFDTKKTGTATGADVYIRIFQDSSEFTDESAASASNYDIRLQSDGTSDRSWAGPTKWLGVERCKIVSVWIETGGTAANFSVVGTTPGS